jgi:hypothetical protein
MPHSRGVGSWGSYSFLFGPIVAMAVVGVLALILRWVVPTRPPGATAARLEARMRRDYGLLVPVATPQDETEAEFVRSTLARFGIRTTLARTHSGLRVLVFPEDAARARSVLQR